MLMLMHPLQVTWGAWACCYSAHTARALQVMAVTSGGSRHRRWTPQGMKGMRQVASGSVLNPLVCLPLVAKSLPPVAKSLPLVAKIRHHPPGDPAAVASCLHLHWCCRLGHALGVPRGRSCAGAHSHSLTAGPQAWSSCLTVRMGRPAPEAWSRKGRSTSGMVDAHMREQKRYQGVELRHPGQAVHVLAWSSCMGPGGR
jgi:hypothetical protein